MISSGNVTVSSGYKATYRSQANNSFAPSLTQNFIRIAGAFGRIVRVLRISISGNQTTAGIVQVLLRKQSTLDTIASGVSQTVGNLDTKKQSPTALVTYGGSSVMGTLVGIVRAVQLTVPTTTPTGSKKNEYIFDFVTKHSQGIVLRSANENLAINLNGVTVSGGTFNVWFEWTEE